MVVLSRGKLKPKVVKLPDEHRAVTPVAIQAAGTEVPVTVPAATTLPSRSKIEASGSPPLQSAEFAQISMPPMVSRPAPPELNVTDETLLG